MPANLPPQYFETEKKLKTARTTNEKIDVLEELLSIIPKHKGTEKLQAQLKTKIARLRVEAAKKSSTARHGSSPIIKKSGAGQIVLLGAPNSGKSRLIKALTNTDPLVGEYPFTTLNCTPAMMFYKDIQIQLVDTPPITSEYIEPSLPDLVKAADGVMILLDPTGTDPLRTYKNISDIFQTKKIVFFNPAQPEPVTLPLTRKKTLYVCTKCDLPQSAGQLEIMKNYFRIPAQFIPVSAFSGKGLGPLRDAVYSLLEIIRVYSKIPGRKAEMDNPFTLKKGSTVMDMARAVHQDFSEKLKFARIWGKKTFPGQMVKRDHVLDEEDIIELHI